MRVLLVHPRIREGADPPLLSTMRAATAARPGGDIYRTAPLACLLLAGHFPEGAATLVDEAAGDTLPPLSGFDLLLVTAATCQAPRALALARAAREAGLFSCVGGPHATARPGDFAGAFDAVFVGEAEETFPAFLHDFAAGRPRARYGAEGPADLDRAPLPRYTLAPRGRYHFLPLQAGRGCPHACAYCASSTLYGRGVRGKSPARLAAECAALAAAHPGALAYVVDDNLFADPALADATLAALAAAGLRFIAYGDPSLAGRPDLPARLAAARCARLLVGFDSLDPSTLERVAPRKAAHLPRYADLVGRYQAAGVGVFGGFMVGFDEDDIATFDRVADFVDATGLSETCVSIVTPLPGAPEHDRLLAEGRLVERDLSRYDGFHLVFRHPRLDAAAFEFGTKAILDRHLDPAAVRRRAAAMKAAFREALDR